MLIKLVCDDSCGFVKRLGAAEMRVGWVVEEDVPLRDPTHIAALNAAINKSHRETSSSSAAIAGAAEVTDFSGYALLLPTSDEPVDTQRTPNELGLRSGATLHLMHEAERVYAQMPLASPTTDSTQQQQPVNTEDDTDEENDESYVSHDIGWFPFMLRPREGEPLVLLNDPSAQVQEPDAEPVTQSLCETCGTVVSHGDALRVSVDRHYKPMLMRQEFLEVCMEKLGGGQLRRWQTRYVQMSEKSVDWFAEKPRPGVKSRIHGHRYLVCDGECQVEALIDRPDPQQYPKCGDKSFFHFGVVFRNPRKTYLFRVTTEQKRAMVLSFLDTCVRRVTERAPQRNPVVWKQRADAFLVNAAELGEQHSRNRMDIEAVQASMRALETELAELLKHKPRLQAALDTQASCVQTLRADVNGHKAGVKRAQQRLQAAQMRIAEEERLLHEKELEMGDEIRKAAMLKSHVLQQHDTAEQRIRELRARAEALQEHETALFRKWRSFEERHRVPQGPSPRSGLYSFSEGGIGIPCGSPRISTELAASAARLALNTATKSTSTTATPAPIASPILPRPSDASTPLHSAQRQLLYSGSRERST
ncbi:hypothetical protein DQ04_09091020 [Trypanosoma grayi]|uniref:hypothetical protein n=1 Tax=Trypanosoma grayi TaxID=71804 RepID=UPI0004F4A493|nr:hypothetical protein DQ04_09091020 [Trypanosoma grayi]KEG07687.1 hypothetical protein DQ04_09091020 [Trypanosoma grayi]